MVSRRTLLKAGVIGGLPVATGVGLGLHPIRPNLHDVNLRNDRPDSVTAELRLTANGEEALRTTVDLDPLEWVHLPCEWPQAARSYEMAVRLAGHDEWETITYTRSEKLCCKIRIHEDERSYGPISFSAPIPCPGFGEPSCA